MHQNDLIRYDGPAAHSVVLVGNGAIFNGWKPLREVLDPMINDGHGTSDVVKKIKVQNRETFHQLAIFSYRFKLYRAQTLRNLIERKISIKDLEKNGLDPIVDEFLKLRSEIGESYKTQKAELSLKLSGKIKGLIGENALYITTNWDETLWNEHSIKNVAYLHGRASLPESIVFPTELLIDDTIYDPRILEGFEECSEEFKTMMGEVFRFKSIAQLMDTINFSCEMIQKAKRLIVWGFNLADYDADINTLLSTNAKPDQELVVINPDFTSFGRALGLTNITTAKYFNPETELCLELSGR